MIGIVEEEEEGGGGGGTRGSSYGEMRLERVTCDSFTISNTAVHFSMRTLRFSLFYILFITYTFYPFSF